MAFPALWPGFHQSLCSQSVACAVERFEVSRSSLGFLLHFTYPPQLGCDNQVFSSFTSKSKISTHNILQIPLTLQKRRAGVLKSSYTMSGLRSQYWPPINTDCVFITGTIVSSSSLRIRHLTGHSKNCSASPQFPR